MAMTRLQLQTDIYNILSKSTSAAGLVTTDKVNTAIQDALDYIQAKMVKIGAEWLTQVRYVNYTANNPLVTLPTDLVVINFIKIATSADTTKYVPIENNENATGVSDTQASGIEGNLPVWRFSGAGTIRLEPMPSSSMTNGIMIDGVFLTTKLSSDSSQISGDLDNRIFTTYAKWRAASICRSLTTKEMPPWSKIEDQWELLVNAQIARRWREPGVSRPFANY